MTEDLLKLKERITGLSDDELISIVTVSVADYRQEAVDFAHDEIERRGLRLEDDHPVENLAPESPEPESEPVVQPGVHCSACGGLLRRGLLIAEKELTIIFSDNREERFVRVTACTECAHLSMIVDFETDVS